MSYLYILLLWFESSYFMNILYYMDKYLIHHSKKKKKITHQYTFKARRKFTENRWWNVFVIFFFNIVSSLKLYTVLAENLKHMISYWLIVLFLHLPDYAYLWETFFFFWLQENKLAYFHNLRFFNKQYNICEYCSHFLVACTCIVLMTSVDFRQGALLLAP